MATSTLIEIIDRRDDTTFHGERVTDSGPDVYPETELYEDEFGVTYTRFHDYIRSKSVDGTAAGMLVADADGRDWMDHAHVDLPHLMGLYVREPYRSNGIGTELVDEFMADHAADTCVVYGEPHATPFYAQLDCDVVWPRTQRNTPTTRPLSATTP